MSKFFFLFGCFIVFLCLIFLAFSYTPPFSSNLQKETTQNSPETVLYFKPNPIYSPCLNTNITATIYINSGQNLINSAQIELLYDPKIIHNVNFMPSLNNFFGKDYSVLLNEVREEYGRATLALEENPSRSAQKGNSAVATISFQVLSTDASQTATISFLNKSTATNNSYEGSLLKEARPLEIICKP